MKRLLVAIVALGLLVGCAPQEKRYSAINLDCFDTVTELVAYTKTEKEFEILEKAVFSELERYHRLFDRYNEYEGVTNLKTINENAKNGPVKVDPELFELLCVASDFYDKSHGAFNVFLGEAIELWRDCRERSLSGDETCIPELEELEEAASRALADNVILNGEDLTVEITAPTLSIDLGAIAKGFAADKLADLIRELGYESVLLSIGGNVVAIGTRADGKPWSIGIQDPLDENGTVASVELVDKSLVTSGSYQRYYYHEGKRYHHVIDPVTLMPADYFLSVSILCDSSTAADALSTALFCLPQSDGHALLQSVEGAEALWVNNDGTVSTSLGFEEALK